MSDDRPPYDDALDRPLGNHPDGALICRHLRAKNAYGGREGGAHPWQLVDVGTMNFRCARTLQSWGPDGGLATESYCRAGRGCWVGSVVPD